MNTVEGNCLTVRKLYLVFISSNYMSYPTPIEFLAIRFRSLLEGLVPTSGPGAASGSY